MIRNYYGPPIPPISSRRTGVLILIALFAGLISLVAEIGLFERTFIPLSVSMKIWTAFAIISFAIFIRLFWKFKRSFSAILIALFYGYASAGLPLYIFMATNYYFADSKTTQQTFAVISAELEHPKHPPDVVITYKGYTKEIYYEWGTPVDRYKNVILPIRKGLWGFDIIYQKDTTVGLPAQ
jgi:hypothetical protein